MSREVQRKSGVREVWEGRGFPFSWSGSGVSVYVRYRNGKYGTSSLFSFVEWMHQADLALRSM